MYRRNYRARSRSSFSRPRFGGRKLRLASEVRNWTRSQFHFDQAFTPPSSANSEQLVMFHVASIAMSLQQGGGIGFAMGQMTRRLELGGIVYDTGMYNEGDIDGSIDVAAKGLIYTYDALCVDKLYTDLAAGGLLFPNAVQTWSPWKPQFPTETMTTTTPDDTTQEGDFPLRILRQKYDMRGMVGRRVIDQDEGALYVPDDQLLAPRFPTVNKRLRLVLDDNQGLFLVHAHRTGPLWDAPSARGYRVWATGALYWRYKT